MYQFRTHHIVGAFAIVGTLLVAFPAGAQTPGAQTPADNTRVNERDRNKDEATADQQKENPSDRQLSQKIRAAVMGDKTLSTYAHNVKIIAQDGQITLKGPVRTESEKKTIETMAIDAAGKGRVINEISIAPEKK
jgi:hyperosmotically inducible protein